MHPIPFVTMTYTLNFRGQHSDLADDTLSYLTSINLTATTTFATRNALRELAAQALDLALLAGPHALVRHLTVEDDRLITEVGGGDGSSEHICDYPTPEVLASLQRLSPTHRHMLWFQTILGLHDVPRFRNNLAGERLCASAGMMVVDDVRRQVQSTDGTPTPVTLQFQVGVCEACAAEAAESAANTPDISPVTSEWSRPDVQAVVAQVAPDIVAELTVLARQTLVDAIEVEHRSACLLEYRISGPALIAGYTSPTLQHFEDCVETFTVVPRDTTIPARLAAATFGSPSIANALWVNILRSVGTELADEKFATAEDIDYVLDGASTLIAHRQLEGTCNSPKSA